MILNLSEAAKKARIARSTLYNMKKNGNISFVKCKDGKPGVEESELARVFPDCFRTDTKLQTNTSSNTQNTDQLSEKIASLQLIIDEQKDRQLIELKERLAQAENRVDELIKVTTSQSNQLLLTNDIQKKSWLKRLFRAS